MNLLYALNMLSPGDSFVTLFAEMSAVVIVLFIIGIILCCIEIFTPGFGVFGIVGLLAVIAAIIVRMLQGGDAWMLLYMLLIAVILFVTIIVLGARSIKKGRLSKSAMFNVDSSVGEGHTEGTMDYKHLLGLVGTTRTMLRPIGQADIDGEMVDVVAKSGFIDSDVLVEVVAVEGGTIRVRVLPDDKTTNNN